MVKKIDQPLIDTHCHLNDGNAFPNPEQEIHEAMNVGVAAFVVIGIDLDSSKRALELAEKFPCVYAAVGWHPNYAQNYSSANLNQIADLFGHPKAIALGEIGLDYHWDYATPEQQNRCLLDQLQLAKELQKPIVFHCRKAYDELLKLLSENPPEKFILHCFSGSSDHANVAIKLGSYFGIGGAVTYKKSNELRRIIATLPVSKILLETDSPYLSPEPYRGKNNHPKYLPLIAKTVALYNSNLAELGIYQTTLNAEAVFGVKFAKI